MELRTQRFALIPLFLMGVVFSVLAPLFWTHVESPEAPAAHDHLNPDLYGRVVPSLEYGLRRLQAGELPLWAGDQYCGIPYFANPAHGLWQPLSAVFYLVPVNVGLALHAFLGLSFAGLFMALFLRAQGTGYLAAAIGAMTFAFGGASANIMSRPELLGVLCWAPLLYWVIFEYAERQRGVLVVAGAIVVALMVAGGSPVLALALVTSALGYGAVRVIWHRKQDGLPLLKRLLGIAGMAFLGLVLSAVVWIPFFAWLSTLANPEEALWPSRWNGQAPVSPRELFRAFLLPGAGNLPDLLYIGVVSLILIPAALLRQRGRFDTLFFLLAAVFWLGVMLWRLDASGNTSAWKVLAFPAVISLSVLVGLGADRLLLTGRDPRSPLIWGSSLIVLAVGAIALVLGPTEARGRILPALFILLPFCVIRVRWMGLACGTLLAFLLFVDLRDASNSTYQHPYSNQGAWLEDNLPALREAEALALGERVLTLPSPRQTALPANIGLLLGVPNARGAYWPLTKDQERWWEHLNGALDPGKNYDNEEALSAVRRYATLFNLMGIRVFLGERNLPWMDGQQPENGVEVQFLRTIGRQSLWRNNAALPRVRFVHHWQPVEGGEEALEALLAPDFPTSHTAVVDVSGGNMTELREVLPAGEAYGEEADGPVVVPAVQTDSPESLVVGVDTARAGILVVSDSYAPGWRAYVDGQRASLLQVNGLFRGVALPAGAHTVEFRYAPLSLRVGLALSCIALAAALAWLINAGVRWVLSLLRSFKPAREKPDQPSTALPDGRTHE